MANLADQATRAIFGRSLIVGTTILTDMLDRLINLVSDSRNDFLTDAEMQTRMRRVIDEYETAFSEHLVYTDVVSWVAGMDWVAKQFPSWLEKEFASGVRSPIIPPEPPRFTGRFSGDDAPEQIRFPKIEEAAKRLFEREILTRDEFDDATEAAQQRAFTIAGDLGRGTIETVRNTLVEDIREGTSLEGFRQRLRENLKAGPLNDGHTETVYRTNVQAAFRDGRETLASDPVVTELFPYQEYIPIHDDRVRETHLALGSLGLNGTGIYRRDDPFWDYFTPPWSYNCRCGVNLLTIDKAASKGVREAQQWLDSGRRPERPEWRLGAIPFPPEPGFGNRGRTGALVA